VWYAVGATSWLLPPQKLICNCARGCCKGDDGQPDGLSGLQWACIRGHLHIVQWLLSDARHSDCRWSSGAIFSDTDTEIADRRLDTASDSDAGSGTGGEGQGQGWHTDSESETESETVMDKMLRTREEARAYMDSTARLRKRALSQKANNYDVRFCERCVCPCASLCVCVTGCCVGDLLPQWHNGTTALFLACEYGQLDVARWLVTEAHCDPRSTSNHDNVRPPYRHDCGASHSEPVECFKLLIGVSLMC
jgi:ankyrin repeat protein